MTAAVDLWNAVKADYDAAGLLTLTNIRNRAAVSINDPVGTAAAQAVVNLWPVYAQSEYDPANQTALEIAEMGVIAVLWRRGGSSSSIEQVKWEEVFGDAGLVSKFRKTGARGHAGPSSNSSVQQSSELLSDGRPARPWSDPDSLPPNYLPQRRSVADDR